MSNETHVAQSAEFSYHLETVRLGMWIFLAMEMLFFGAIFFLYGSQRHFYAEAFQIGSQHLEKNLAAWNTAVLLTSSLSMATAVHFSKQRNRRAVTLSLILTGLLGALFIGLKTYEYRLDFQHSLVPVLRWAPAFSAPKELELFFGLYFVATAIHAIHLLIGIAWVMTIASGWSFTRKDQSAYIPRIEVLGLYWHFVDVVWIFLFPLFYLIGQGK